MRFFSKVPGSAYVFSDGTKAVFAHGFLDVTEKAFPGNFQSPNSQFPDKQRDGRPRHDVYREDLLQICNEGNPLIFTQETIKKLQDVGVAERKEVSQKAKSEVEIAKGDQALAGVQGVVTGDVNKGSVGGTDTNTSTVDPNLQQAVFAPRVGPGADALSKAAQLKAEAQARQAAIGQ